MTSNAEKTGEKILVLGVGQLGTAILDSLQPAVSGLGRTITASVSPGSLNEHGRPVAPRHQKYAEAGIDFIALDIVASDISSLVPLFQQFDTVINCMGFVAGEGTQLKITRAVIQAGVSRYFPWQFGVDYDVVGKGSGQPVWDEQYDVRTLLRSQFSTDWVIVSTGMFTSFLFEPAFDVVNLEARTINALGSWETQVTVTSPEDIGRLTTAIYLAQPAIKNKVVYVAGDTLSYGRLADIVEAVEGHAFARRVLTLTALQHELEHNADDQMLRYRKAFALGKGVWWHVEQTYNAVWKIPVQNVEQWLRAR
ncbi:aromatic alcohol reductase [Enterobacter sp. Ap-1006]|uniref:aromatic alcohol reductase n=1 Tax=Enterobacter sp. Ap-1006 TaxID=2608345 RepID=UPI00141ECF49|nr:aromatic alcohol reductase [Enterobacter sp. Ap-1006]NIF49202.1 aromatic alcohol reductase [Enterobacter sp. Ap-1006]